MNNITNITSEDASINEALKIIPAAFIERMLTDYWEFGLLMTTGDIVAIKTIKSVSPDGKWLEVELMPCDTSPYPYRGINAHQFEQRAFVAPSNRTSATISVDNIVAAFEFSKD